MPFQFLRKLRLFRPNINKLLQQNNIPRIISALFDPEKEIRLEAYESILQKTSHQEVIPLLLQAFDEQCAKNNQKGNENTAILSNLLEELKSPSSLEPLIKRLSNGSLQFWAQITLEGFGPNALPVFLKHGNNSQEEVQMILANLIDELLENYPEATSIFNQSLKETGLIQEPTHFKMVIPLLQSKNTWIQIQALLVLVHAKVKEALLDILLVTKTSNLAFNLIFLEHLGDFQDESVLPILTTFLRHQEDEIQEAVIRAIEKWQTPKTIRILYERLFEINEENFSWDFIIQTISQSQHPIATQFTIDLLLKKEPNLSYGTNTLLLLMEGMHETQPLMAIPALEEIIRRYQTKQASIASYAQIVLTTIQKNSLGNHQ